MKLSQQVSFDLFTFFLLGIARDAGLDFGFPSNFTASYNHGNNIVGRFDVLPNFLVTTSETKSDY